MKNVAQIWYLFHSGYAVKYGSRLLIFDYYNNRAEKQKTDLTGGIFDPFAHSDEEIFVFASHKHGDHFNPVILSWEKQHPKLHYILSDDISVPRDVKNVLSVSAEKAYTFSGISIRTLTSTDEGLAFLVKMDDLTLYHAGDLHWWHWDGEPDPWNPDMEKKYKQQIAKLKNTAIDIAFIAVDPRQEEFSHLGISWFLQEVRCPHVFPMHFGKDYSIMEVLRNHPEIKPWLSRIHPVSERGQCFLMKPDA
ncbi:MAG: MBL fold metallo-hydrolase [Thermoclostridium sp.]|nr:MBL fold metallo-hydrolase [Thermoclostridium sp.]